MPYVRSNLVSQLREKLDVANQTIKELKSQVHRLENPSETTGQLALPSIYYYIEDEQNGRAAAYFKRKAICSTISHMDALVDTWKHFLSIKHFSGVSIDWRLLETGWVWWYSIKYDTNNDWLRRKGLSPILSNVAEKVWIASKDFTSLRDCILAAAVINPIS